MTGLENRKEEWRRMRRENELLREIIKKGIIARDFRLDGSFKRQVGQVAQKLDVDKHELFELFEELTRGLFESEMSQKFADED